MMISERALTAALPRRVDAVAEILVDLVGRDLSRLPATALLPWLNAVCELIAALPRAHEDRWIGLLAQAFMRAFPTQARRGPEKLGLELRSCVARAAHDWALWKSVHAPRPAAPNEAPA